MKVNVKYGGWMLHRLAKVWGGKEVFVYDGEPPRTDGKCMYLPLRKEDWLILMGLGQHEAAHLRFSNFKIFKEAVERLSLVSGKDMEIVKFVINLFEDYRIEKLFSEIFLGARRYFKMIYKKFVSERGKPKSVMHKIFYDVIDTLYDKACDSVAMNCKKIIDKNMTFASVLKASEILLRYLPNEIFDEQIFGKFCNEMSDGAKSRLVSQKELKVIRKNKATKGHKKEDHDKGKGHEDERMDDGEEDSSSDERRSKNEKKIMPKRKRNTKGQKDESKDDSDETISAIDDKILKRMRKKIKDYVESEKRKMMERDSDKKIKEEKSLKQHITATKKFERKGLVLKHKIIKKLKGINFYTSYSTVVRKYNEIIKNNSSLIQVISSQLSHLRMSKMKCYANSGRLRMNRAISKVASQGAQSSLMFQREVSNYGVDVLLLVDQSGSMSGNKIEKAKEAVIVFSEALKRVPNVNFAVYGFATEPWEPVHTIYTIQYKAMDEPVENCKKVAAMRTYIGNRDGFHFRVAGDILLNQGKIGNKKVLIILSDGVPCDNCTNYVFRVAFEDTQKALNELRQKGIYVFALGVGVEKTWKKLYGNYGAIIKENDIKTPLLRLVSLIQKMTYTI
ncbi:MAG: VWA domain-containing protein [Candidatus Odinarchaeia archaeon]